MENPVENLVRSLMVMGGRPAGDPQAMSDAASKFRQAAYRVQGNVAIVGAQERIDYFEGPQADMYATDLLEDKGGLATLADRLHEAANQFERMAARLANDQVHWDQHLNRTVSGFPGAVVDQAKRRLGWQ